MDLPFAQLDTQSQGYNTLDDSAWTALSGLGDNAQEHAGLILQHPNGQFFYTTPLASQQHDHFGFRVGVPQGWKIAGVYHTHPGVDNDGQVFSPDDLAMATKLGVPSYIRFLKDGSVRKYTPGQTPQQNLPAPGNKFMRKVATGDTLDAAAIRSRLEALRQKAAQAQTAPAG